MGGEIYDDLDEVIEVNGQAEETYEPPGVGVLYIALGALFKVAQNLLNHQG